MVFVYEFVHFTLLLRLSNWVDSQQLNFWRLPRLVRKSIPPVVAPWSSPRQRHETENVGSSSKDSLDNWLGYKVANRNAFAVLTTLDDRLETTSAILVKS